MLISPLATTFFSFSFRNNGAVRGPWKHVPSDVILEQTSEEHGPLDSNNHDGADESDKTEPIRAVGCCFPARFTSTCAS